MCVYILNFLSFAFMFFCLGMLNCHVSMKFLVIFHFVISYVISKSSKLSFLHCGVGCLLCSFQFVYGLNFYFLLWFPWTACSETPSGSFQMANSKCQLWSKLSISPTRLYQVSFSLPFFLPWVLSHLPPAPSWAPSRSLPHRTFAQLQQPSYDKMTTNGLK